MKLPVIKSKVTYLEMTSYPRLSDVDLKNFDIRYISNPEYDFYMNLYRDVGRDYIWNYRPGQSRQEVTDLINSKQNELYVLYENDNPVGMAEIDVTDANSIEIIHFGQIPKLINQGIGRKFFNNILVEVWNKNPERVWLATCGLDHPKAISFYQNAGFEIFKETEDNFYDYRYSDFYDLTDAPQIPLAQ